MHQTTARSPQIYSTRYQTFLEKLRQAKLDAGLNQVDVPMRWASTSLISQSVKLGADQS